MEESYNRCLDEHDLLGVGCNKDREHAGTHAWWDFVDGVHTFVTWGRRQP